jgi:ABC-type branched-subunit amino acid transport system ATPase component
MSILLACDRLSMRFGGLVALNQLSLSVNEGEVLGLIGPNGSGKTTFFNVITGIYQASEGRVDYRRQDLTQMKAQEIYRVGVTRTFQRSRLCLPLSIFDNLMIGNHRRLDHSLWFNLFQRQAFRRQFEEHYAEAHKLVRTFSASLAGKLFEAAGSVNMIDRRRIEICRALISQPSLLLLDEPSAGMTHEETRELMDDILIVREHMPGLTIIIIEHEMNVIERITERCIVLNYGQKICEGPYAQIAADREVQEAYLGTA